MSFAHFLLYSICITADINLQQWWFDDGFGLKSVYLLCFYEFYLMLKAFINIREYAIEIIYISDHRKKDKCLSFNVLPHLVL